MTLADDLAALGRTDRPSKTCSVCWAFKDAPPEDRATVNTALATGPVTNEFVKVLVDHGYDVADAALRRHRLKGHQL